MVLKKVLVAFGLLTGLIAIGYWDLNRERKVSKEDAMKLAASTLERHCENQKWPVKAFRLTEMTAEEGDGQWMIVYESTGIQPTQQVIVGISRNGGVEVSTNFDGRDGYPLNDP